MTVGDVGDANEDVSQVRRAPTPARPRAERPQLRLAPWSRPSRFSLAASPQCAPTHHPPLHPPPLVSPTPPRALLHPPPCIQVVEVLGSADDKWPWLSRRLGHFASLGSVLVFVSTKQAAEDLARQVRSLYSQAGLFHSQASLFHSQASLSHSQQAAEDLARQVSPLYSQASHFHSQATAPPFTRQRSPEPLQLSPLYPKASLFHSQASPFYSQASPSPSQASPHPPAG